MFLPQVCAKYVSIGGMPQHREQAAFAHALILEERTKELESTVTVLRQSNADLTKTNSDLVGIIVGSYNRQRQER